MGAGHSGGAVAGEDIPAEPGRTQLAPLAIYWSPATSHKIRSLPRQPEGLARPPSERRHTTKSRAEMAYRRCRRERFTVSRKARTALSLRFGAIPDGRLQRSSTVFLELLQASEMPRQQSASLTLSVPIKLGHVSYDRGNCRFAKAIHLPAIQRRHRNKQQRFFHRRWTAWPISRRQLLSGVHVEKCRHRFQAAAG